MEGPRHVCHWLRTQPFTLSFARSFHTDIFTFLPLFSTYCSDCEWLGYLTQCPVILPAGFKNIQGSGFCVGRVFALIWWVVGGVVLPACSRCSELRHPHCSPPPPLAPPDCSQLPLKGWDFIDAQSAFLHGHRAQNYTTVTAASARPNPAQRSLFKAVLDTFE